MRSFSHAVLLLGVALGLLGLAGCGGDAAAGGSGAVLVSGKVTIGGVAIDNGGVEFIPKPGFVAPVVAAPIKNGAYSVTAENEALPGPYVVTIRGTSKTGKKMPHPDYLNCFVPETKPVVAPRYTSNAETPLSAELTLGTQTQDFLLPALTPQDQADLDKIEAEKKAQDAMQSGG